MSVCVQGKGMSPGRPTRVKMVPTSTSDTAATGASNLMSQKIRIGSDDPNAYQFLSKNGTNNIKVESVNEYRAAIKSGFAARTTADMTTEGWFLQVDHVLSFMERVKPSQHSLFTAQDLK